MRVCCFVNDTATTEIYTLSLHDALPISRGDQFDARRGAAAAAGDEARPGGAEHHRAGRHLRLGRARRHRPAGWRLVRSEEHTSELQSRQYLVCRLLLEKKKPVHV